MANKQKKKQKKAPQAQQPSPHPPQPKPTNQVGQAIEIELGGSSKPQPVRAVKKTPKLPAKIYTRDVILAKLSEAGYHRARVQTLMEYDKIVGGIIWAMNMIHHQPLKRDWVFKETPKGTLKSEAQITMECKQLLATKVEMKNRTPITAQNLFDCTPAIVGPLVDFVLAEISNDILDVEKFHVFKNFFESKYRDREAAIYDFLEALHRFNDNQYSYLLRARKFDYSIIRDEWVTGRMMLYEYVTYQRTGRRTYPCIFNADSVKKFNEKNGEQDKKLRETIDGLAVAMMQEIPESTKENIKFMAFLIDDIRFGVELSDIEVRFLDEATKYYRMSTEFHTLKKSFTFLDETCDEINPSTLERVEKIVDMVLTRWKKLKTSMNAELVERKQREYNLRRNHDEYDPEVYWNHDNCDKADNLEKENKVFEASVNECESYPDKMLTVFYAYRSLSKAREDSAPEDEDEGHIDLFPEVDNSIADDITGLISELNFTIDNLEAMDPAENKIDVDHRRALRSYVSDCKNLLSDWYWKAKMMRDERRDLCRKMKHLRLMSKLDRHKLYFADREAILLMKLNSFVRENEKKLDELEKASQLFIDDWEKKKDVKAMREAAIAAANEIKRLRALKEAKQAKHGKNGNGKKGSSGKKGRNGPRR